MKASRVGLSQPGKLILFSFAAVMVTGCTYNEPRVRPAPLLMTPVGTNPWSATVPAAHPASNGINLYCAEGPSTFQRIFGTPGDLVSSTNSHADACIYVSVDPRELPGADTPSLDSATLNNDVTRLLTISDNNCSNFLARSFALETNLGFFKNFVNTAVSSTASVISLANVPSMVTSGVSAGNAVIGGGVDAFNSEYFANKTFQTFEIAIQAERLKRSTDIRRRLDATKAGNPTAEGVQPYLNLQDALLDVEQYDRACSYEEGLELLSKSANDDKTSAESGAKQALVPPKK